MTPVVHAAGVFLLLLRKAPTVQFLILAARDGGTFDDAQCREPFSGRLSGVVTFLLEAVFENPFGIV